MTKNNELRNKPFPTYDIREGFPGGRKPPSKIGPIKDHIIRKSNYSPWIVLFAIPIVLFIGFFLEAMR